MRLTTGLGINHAWGIFFLSTCLVLTACAKVDTWLKTPTPLPTAMTTQPPGTAISSSPKVTDDIETLVLRQVSELISMCPPDFGSNAFFTTADESTVRFRLVCGAGWGHASDVSIWRYDNSPAVQAAFADMRENLPDQDFHGYPALEWRCFARSYANCEPASEVTQGMMHRNHCWQADRWLICAHAFDDTGSEAAVDPLKISEAVYQASLEHGLLPKKQ